MSAGVDRSTDLLWASAPEVHDVEFVTVIAPHGEQNFCPIRRPRPVMDVPTRGAVPFLRMAAIPIHNPYLRGVLTSPIGKKDVFVVWRNFRCTHILLQTCQLVDLSVLQVQFIDF